MPGLCGYVATRSSEEKKNKAFVIGVLTTYIISLIMLGFTGFWDTHQQLLYLPHVLMLIYLTIRFSARGEFSYWSFGIAMITLAVFLSGTIYLTDYVILPRQIKSEISNLTEYSSETVAFRSMYPDGTGFARLG